MEIETSLSLKKEILLAMGSEDRRLTAWEVLEEAGFRSMPVSTSKEAMSRFLDARVDGNPFDMVIVGLDLPDFNGPELARIIRAAQSSAIRPSTPIVLLAEHAYDGDKTVFDLCLNQPLQVNDIMELMRVMMKK